MRKILILTMLATIAQACFAYGSDKQQPDNKNWRIDLGLVGIVSPKSAVKNTYRILVVPSLGVTWKKRLFASVYRGLGIYFWNKKADNAGFAFNYNFSGNSAYRDDFGLPSIKPYPVATLFVSHLWKYIMLRATADQDISGKGYGGKLNIGAALGFPIWLKQRLFGAIGPSMTLVTHNYMQTRYGVTKAQETSSTPAYNAKGGIEAIGASVGAFWMGDKISIRGFTSFNWLQKNAYNSPLVHKRMTVVGILMASYFWKF